MVSAPGNKPSATDSIDEEEEESPNVTQLHASADDMPTSTSNDLLSQNEYNILFKKYVDNLEIRRTELSNLFGLILSILSTASTHRVQAHEDYIKVNEERDGLKLWNIVYQTHQTSDPHLGESVRKTETLERFYNFYQKPQQPLEDYYEEFSELVRCFTNVRLSIPSEQDQAIRFLRGLNRATYADLHLDMNNCPSQYLHIHKSPFSIFVCGQLSIFAT